nr:MULTISPECIES: DUF5979 domain-containing protein [unclassified Actinomyces]
MRGLAARGARTRVAATLLTVLASLALVVQGLAVPAAAAVNPKIEVTDLTLTHIVDATEKPAEGQMTESSLALLQYKWDATKTQLKDGDSFTVELPEVLKYRVPDTKPINYTRAGVEYHVGDCTISDRLMTCTFNAKMEELALVNNDMRGTGKVQLSAAGSTTNETVPFKINEDKTVDVDLPGEGGIKKNNNAATYDPLKIVKGISGMSEKSTHANWFVTFGTEKLSEENGVVYDGTNDQTITFYDTLGAGMTCPEQMSNVWFHVGRSRTAPDRVLTKVDSAEPGAASGKDASTAYGLFNMVFDCGVAGPDGKTPITITVTGPFAADTNYSITYSTPVTTPNGLAVPGFEYKNEVSIAGTTMKTEGKRTFANSFSITVEMKPGLGTFRVFKTVKGDGANQVGAGATFPVTVNYELPEGTTAADFKDSLSWTAPGTLNADQRTGTVTFNAELGTPTPFKDLFPVGTKVTLSEDPEQGSTQLGTDYSWRTPEFSVAELTIEDQKDPIVNLTNYVDIRPNGFQVLKKVDDTPGAADKDYTFTYTCTLPDQTQKTGEIKAKGNGDAVDSPEAFPVGTTCKVTEKTDAAGIDGYTLDDSEAGEQSVTIGLRSQPVATATFTNKYTQDAGRFSVSKTVKGDAGTKVPPTYTFDYTCTAPGKDNITGEIVVDKGGSKDNGKDIPVGYHCEVTERVAEGQPGTAYLEGYTLDVTSTPGVDIAKGGNPTIAVTNTYTVNKGSFSVKKVIVGPTFIGSNNTFTVYYTCDNGEGGQLKLTGGGDAATVKDLPYGISCTITEDTDAAQRDGYALATAYSTGMVTIGVTNPSPEVTITNTYTALKGGFTISKTVDGDGASLAANTKFTFEYACTPAAAGQDVFEGTVELKGGETATFDQVPVGPCVVTERDATIDGADLSTVVTVNDSSDGVDGNEAHFSVSDGTTVKVAATNTYTRHRGSFSVAKAVVGGQDSYTQDTFVFDYTCTDGSQGRLDVPGDGTAVTSETIPTGSECTVTERADSAGRTGYTVVSEISDGGKVTIAEKDKVVALTATNTYSPVPTPTPSATKPSKRPLAKTGASNVVLLGVLGTALVAGGGLTVLAMRRRDEA